LDYSARGEGTLVEKASTNRPSGHQPHLPDRRTSFVGRDQELEEVRRALAEARMITLTGVGGCGKTSLAVEAARHAADEFPDGTWLAELAPISDPALVPGAVAAALGVLGEPGRSFLEPLADSLQGKRLLLLLDNCEHVLEGAAELCDELLRRCPEVRILATSRESLGIDGEHKLPVPPLGLPPEEADAGAVAGSEAGKLFLDRARAVFPGIRIDEANAGAVGSICRRLDGIPLAIELAAARIGLLTPQEIDERLGDRFRLLRTGARGALPRHRTLHALIDWSHDLLNGEEAVLYRRLGVFVGGFTLEAAEQVCSDDLLTSDGVLDLLGQLVEKSLVVAEEQEERTRYGMLETVREHAVERLRTSGEEGEIRSRHLAWCSSFVERSETDLAGPGRMETALATEREFSNVRAAFAWSLESGEVEAALGLLPHRRFWQSVQGHTAEVRAWVEAALSRAADADPSLRAGALAEAGEFQRVNGDLDRARRYLEEALSIQRELPDRAAIGETLYMLGRVESTAGRDERAHEITEESVAVARAAGDQQGLGESLSQLGEITYNRGAADRARPLLEESLSLAREAGDAHTIADSLRVLGMIERDAGRSEEARACLAEALALQRGLADWFCTSLSLAVLGDLALQKGEPGRADALFAESLSIQGRIDYHHRWMTDSLWGLGAAAAGQGRLVRAARLLGAQGALRREAGAPFRLAAVERHDDVLSALRQEMDDDTFATAWKEGQAMRREDVLAYALAGREPGIAPFEENASRLEGLEAEGGPTAVAARIGQAAPTVLHREGEYFSVAFEGEVFRLKDSKGLRYLARMLVSPGREFHVLDLVAAQEGVGPPRGVMADESMEVSRLGHAGEVLDPQAKAAYRRRIAELQGDLQEGESWNDPERAARAREELDFLAGELAAATGLGGRDRRAASASERARVNVTRAVRAALARIRENSPTLGRHLDATVRTGTYCAYEPDPRVPVHWRV
jgi:non-specific serine/threonine protein kinase